MPLLRKPMDDGEGMNLRDSARDRFCTIRLPEFCNGDPATTVLAHFRMSGQSGMGYKSPDVFGAFACSKCHAVVDAPANFGVDRDWARLAHLEGVIRTQAIWLTEGLIKVGRKL